MEDSRADTQKRLYDLLGDLRKMSKDVPQMLQQRLTLELLSGLANSMLDGTVYAIVENLSEIQQVTEKQAFEQRQQLTASHTAERQTLARRQKSDLTAGRGGAAAPRLESGHQQELQNMQQRQQAELTRCHMKIVTQLDQKVSEQQVILEKAGVPGFYVTNDPQEIRLQQCLLRFIMESQQNGTGP